MNLKAARYCKLSRLSSRIGKRKAMTLLLHQGVAKGPETYSLSGFIETDSVFVHIPKAAGVSVALSLYGNLGMGHCPISVMQDFIRKSALERMFVFTFVRNPWDRIYSAYNFLKGGGWARFDAAYSEKFLKDCGSFEQFVNEILPQEEARQKVHFLNDAKFLTGMNGEYYPFDFVGRFETIERDFERVRQIVNPSARLDHRNSTKGQTTQGYRGAYTNEMIDIVDGLYGETARALGYDFDGFTQEVPFLQAPRSD